VADKGNTHPMLWGNCRRLGGGAPGCDKINKKCSRIKLQNYIFRGKQFLERPFSLRAATLRGPENGVSAITPVTPNARNRRCDNEQSESSSFSVISCTFQDGKITYDSDIH
jgi:hypothetical protein